MVLEEHMTYNLDTLSMPICSVPSQQEIKVPAQLLRVQKSPPEAPNIPFFITKRLVIRSTHDIECQSTFIWSPPNRLIYDTGLIVSFAE